MDLAQGAERVALELRPEERRDVEAGRRCLAARRALDGELEVRLRVGGGQRGVERGDDVLGQLPRVNRPSVRDRPEHAPSEQRLARPLEVWLVRDLREVERRGLPER